MGIDEEIARLVEPDNEHNATWVGYEWSEESRQVQPRKFSQSIDASLAVIEKRWDDPWIQIDSTDAPNGVRRVEFCPRTGNGGQHVGDGPTTAIALAHALLLALQSERTHAR